MELSINFASTEEVYGVNPKELANMTYKEALERKLEYVKRSLRETAYDIYSAYGDNSVGYEEYSAANLKYKRLVKALELVELQLSELE